MKNLILESEDGLTELTQNTLVVALDDSGNEDFSDPNHPVFAIAGCAFLVRDYSRLIEDHWLQMHREHFAEVQRPLHASTMQFTQNQMEALANFFTSNYFFRIGVTVGKTYLSEVKHSVVQVVGSALLNRLLKICEQVQFSRVFVIFEASDRLEAKVMKSLSGFRFLRGKTEIPIELATLPKSASFAALEVADFIAHTAGAQARTIKVGLKKERKDFQLIFKSVDKRLTSFMHVTKAKYKKPNNSVVTIPGTAPLPS